MFFLINVHSMLEYIPDYQTHVIINKNPVKLEATSPVSLFVSLLFVSDKLDRSGPHLLWQLT